MKREYLLFEFAGQMSFGHGPEGMKFWDVTFVNIEEHHRPRLEQLRVPKYKDIVLLGSEKIPHEYKKRRVKINVKKLFHPAKGWGIIGTTDYYFPDSGKKVDNLEPSIEDLLKDLDINSKRNVIDSTGEDRFLYAIGTDEIDQDKVTFLRIGKYREPSPPGHNDFIEWMNKPYTPLGSKLKPGKAGISKSTHYLTHRADKFCIKYLGYEISEGKKEEFLALVAQNQDLKPIKEDLSKAMRDPIYMEAICKRLEAKISPLIL